MASVDGIKKPKLNQRPSGAPKILRMDGIVSKRQSFVKPIFQTPIVRPVLDFSRIFYAQKKTAAFMATVLLILGFISGMWSALSTNQTAADNKPEVLGAYTDEPVYSVPLDPAGNLGPVNSVPNEVLFNMTISQLENYLTQALKTPELRQAETLAERKIKLKAYLEEKKSPLSDIVNTLAELKHWKIVLAVSNSESSLGKRCYNNNCSGIGVEPGHPLWRNYNSKAEWAKDLDRLIEKRYKDWTLEEMNGVYNYPGSKNWLLASKQILEALQDRGIE